MITKQFLLLVLFGASGVSPSLQAQTAVSTQAATKLRIACINRTATVDQIAAWKEQFHKHSSVTNTFSEGLSNLLNDCRGQTAQPDFSADLSELNFTDEILSGTIQRNPGLALLVQKMVRDDILTDVAASLDEVRPDKQFSAQSDAAGTTALVSKAFGSSLLGLAVDSGALTQSSSGTSNTISGNLEAIAAFLSGQAPVSVDPLNPSRLRKLASQVNVAATFTLSQPSAQTTTATQPADSTSPPAGTTVSVPASVGKFSGTAIKYAVRNPFNPKSKAFQSRWSNSDTVATLTSKAIDALKAADPLVLSANCAACQTYWITFVDKIAAEAGTLDAKTLDEAFDRYVQNTLQALSKDPSLHSEVATAARAVSTYQQAVEAAVSDAQGVLVTFEYDFAKAASQPETHTIKAVLGDAHNADSRLTTLLGSGKDAKSLFTANLGVAFYGGAIPASAKYGRIYNGQAAAEADVPMALIKNKGSSVFSLAGYWQYQPSPSVLNIAQNAVAPGTTIAVPTQVLVGTAGNLFVTQAKISLGGGKSGVSIPIGVKWSNKPNLINGSKVGGQIGINYDLSAFRALF